MATKKEKSAYKNRTSTVLVIILFAILAGIFTIKQGRYINQIGNTPIVTGTESATDARCHQLPRFEGMCLMRITTTKYDPLTNSCVEIEGGGCSVKGGFTSDIECKRLCVDGWKPTTGYEKIISADGFMYKGTLVAFNDVGVATLEIEESTETHLKLIEGFNIDFAEIVTIGVARKESTTHSDDSTLFGNLGTYVLLYKEDEDGRLVSDGALTPFELPGIGINGVTMTRNKFGTITFEYNKVPCGTADSDRCDVRHAKRFVIQNGNVIPSN